MAYTKVKYIIEQTVAVGPDLSQLATRSDFKNPEIRPYLDRYLRGSNGYKAEERVKLMKLLWDCDRHRIRRPPRALRDQLRRLDRGDPPLLPLRRPGVRQRRPLQGLRRAVHGRIRPRRLDACRTSPIPASSAITSWLDPAGEPADATFGSRIYIAIGAPPATITEAVVRAVSSSPNSRVKHISQSLVRHLHAFVRETRLTEPEWRFAIQFLTRTGQACTANRQEFILLSDTLGVSMVDAIPSPLGGRSDRKHRAGTFLCRHSSRVPAEQDEPQSGRRSALCRGPGAGSGRRRAGRGADRCLALGSGGVLRRPAPAIDRRSRRARAAVE